MPLGLKMTFLLHWEHTKLPKSCAHDSHPCLSLPGEDSFSTRTGWGAKPCAPRKGWHKAVVAPLMLGWLSQQLAGTHCSSSAIMLQHLTSAWPSAAAPSPWPGDPWDASHPQLHTWWQWAGGPRGEIPTLAHRCWQQSTLGCAYMGQPVLHPAPALPLSPKHVTSAWCLPWVQAPCCLSLPALPWARTCAHAHPCTRPS